jgi:hypothetical protein
MRLTRCYHVTQVMSGEMGNLVMKVDVKENVEDGLMIWSSVRQIRHGYAGRVRVIQSHPGQTKVT